METIMNTIIEFFSYELVDGMTLGNLFYLFICFKLFTSIIRLFFDAFGFDNLVDILIAAYKWFREWIKALKGDTEDEH